MKYIIKYTYDNVDVGCSCCNYSERELFIYDDTGERVLYLYDPDLWAENSLDLKEYIDTHYPEYSNFIVHSDTVWF